MSSLVKTANNNNGQVPGVNFFVTKGSQTLTVRDTSVNSTSMPASIVGFRSQVDGGLHVEPGPGGTRKNHYTERSRHGHTSDFFCGTNETELGGVMTNAT